MSDSTTNPVIYEIVLSTWSCKLTSITLFAMALYATGAHADDAGNDNPGADTPKIVFSGFGTLGVVHSSEDQADFTSSVFKPNGAGHTHNWSADVDTLLGVQLTANLTPKLSAVLQVISEQNFDNSYRPHVEWANVKYQFTPDFSIRVGRTVLPAFLLSESRKVGYTYPWVRPPREVYGLSPITNSDGLDVNYRMHFGELTNTVQANFGWNDSKIPNNGGTIQARRLWGISNKAEYGALSAQLTYLNTHLTVDSLNSLFGAFRQFGPQGIAIADKYDVNDRPLSFIGIGASYDPGNWFVTSEWGHVDAHSVLGMGSSWYVSGGYRFGKFTPYVTYAHARADNLSDPGLDTSTLPPFLVGPAVGLNTALNSILRTKAVQDTISVGGRWDLMENASLKLQFDHTNIGAGSNGVLTNTQPGFQPGSEFNLLSVTVDFVF